MPVVSKLQSGFTSGELDPKLRARTDIASYYTGAAKLRNVLVIPQGAAKRRPGLEYVTTVATGNVQLIPFTFSATDHYLCVLTTNLMKIYKDGVLMDSVACTISSAQIAEATWAQSYDTLIIFHKDLAPMAFIRAAEDDWSTSAWALNNIPSRNYAGATTTDLTIKKSGGVANIDFADWISGNIITDAVFTASGATFTAGDVGKYIRAGGGYAKITGYTSTTVVACTILTAFMNDIDNDTTHYGAGEWAIEEAVWSATKGYPACGTFYQGRLYMANTAAYPSTIWGSVVNDENNFQNWIPEYDDNGIEVSAGGGIMSNFHRMHSGQHLVVMSDTGEYYVPTSSDEPITPTNISLIRNSSLGSENLPTFELDSSLIYMRAGGKSLLESKYNFADGYYSNKDLSLLSSHLLSSPVSMAHRKQTSTDESDYILVVNDDGTLSVLCVLREQEVAAWTVCHTDGDFKAVAVDGSDMYFVVDRTIGVTPTRFLEKFNDDLLVDCGARQTGTDLDEVTGLAHLNGEEVAVIIDNTVQPEDTVAGGVVSLDRVADDVQAGLSFPTVDDDDGDYQVYVEMMPIEIELGDGISVGKKKRIVEATVMLYETSHIIITKNRAAIRRIGITDLDSPVPKLTENLTINGLLGWDDEITIAVGQNLPLPMQLLGIAYKVRT